MHGREGIIHHRTEAASQDTIPFLRYHRLRCCTQTTVVMKNLWNNTAWARPALGRYANAGGRRTREIDQCRVNEALTLNPIEKHSPTHARNSESYRGATCAPGLGGRGACGASTTATCLFVGDLEASSHLRDRDGPRVRKNISHISSVGIPLIAFTDSPNNKTGWASGQGMGVVW